MNEKALIEEWQDFCDSHGYPQLSADDLLCEARELMSYQELAYTYGFLDRWEKTLERPVCSTQWNITDEVLNFCQDNGMEPIATGGGCDYMMRELPDGSQAILAAADDESSPDRLTDGACITIYRSAEWETWVTFNVADVRTAVHMIKNMETGEC